MKDAADIDLHQAIPVVHGCIPEVAELLDAGVVDQQAHRSEFSVHGLGQSVHRERVTHVAHHVERLAAPGFQLVAQLGDRGAVDVGEHHRHAEIGRAAGQAGTHSGARAGDHRNTAAEDLPGVGHVGISSQQRWPPPEIRRAARSHRRP